MLHRIFGRRRPPQPPADYMPSSATLDTRDRSVVLRRLLGPPTVRVVFDVGAHAGQTAAGYLAEYPAARIYAFEPDPRNVAALSERVAGEPRVVITQTAVCEDDGTRRFHVNHISATGSLLERPAGARRYYSSVDHTADIVEVPVTSLDAFAAAKAVDHIDLLNGARYAGREACIKRYFLRPVGAQNRVRTSGPRRAGTWLDRLVGTFLSE